MFRIGEGLDWEDPLDVEPHWQRRDIKAYGPYWDGILELALGLLAHATGRPPTAAPAVLADACRRPLFEELAQLAPTALEAELLELADDARLGCRGVVAVRNAGPVVARLVRGSVVCEGSPDHRFRDGFVDLLPGEEARLRFDAGVPAARVQGVELWAQNATPVRAPAAERVP
jgi:hypothetical protein